MPIQARVSVAMESSATESTVASPNATAFMYGLIGKMSAKPGQRDALQAILLENDGGMPGCLSYIIAQDSAEPDALWITEVWDDQASHAASLKFPQVQSGDCARPSADRRLQQPRRDDTDRRHWAG
jgi:quinol monooxygenase YgiN